MYLSLINNSNYGRLIMPVPKGTKRFQHNVTGEVRYFRNPPDLSFWSKIGTPGSKNWKWINNTVEEKFIGPQDLVPEGFILGRIKG